MEIERLYEIYQECGALTTDSRDCPEGSMFFALKGESFDGNKFAEMAIEKGCAYAVIDNPDYAKDDRFIVVDDCLKTLKLLARHHRRQFNIPVIGITGTNGKTTTKELTAAVLSEKYNVLYTQGNFNNDIGVPKTLLRLNKDHEIAIIEMGASHPGDIKTLAETAEPDYGIITNVGRAHLQGFGSFEGVVQTKGELFDYLRTKPASTIFLHNENEHLAAISQGLNIVRYGTDNSSSLSVCGKVTACNPLLEIEVTYPTDITESNNSSTQIPTHLIGTYNLTNMLAAAAIGKHFGVSEEQICHALGNYIPSNNRSQLTITESNRLIVDAYNANPTSMMAALRNFNDMQVEHKMVILGDMKELGEVSDEEHQKVADYLKECAFDCVWLVGDEFGKTDCDFRKFNNVDEVKAAINEDKPKNYYILVKGSNSIKLYLLPEYL